MEKGDIIITSLIGGEYIIGKLDKETDTDILITDPRRIQLIPKKEGFGVAFIPINIFVERDHVNDLIAIPRNNIILINNKVQLRQEIMDNYIKHISGVPMEQSTPQENKEPEVVEPEVVPEKES